MYIQISKITLQQGCELPIKLAMHLMAALPTRDAVRSWHPAPCIPLQPTGDLP